MAKKKAGFKKKLMPDREVIVKSLAYGVHTRAARGSQTPVAINDVLQANAAKTAVVNSVAKRVHDLMRQCGKGFKEAMLWQGMLSRMRKGTSDDMMNLLTTLNGMELNSKYPLKRFMSLPLLHVASDKKRMVVRFHTMRPHIKSEDTQYSYELYLLLLGKKETADGLVMAGTDWMDVADATPEMSFEYELPGKVTYYLLCLHFATGKEGKATGTLASRGMRVVGAGMVKD